jgi:hypothetical protein
MSPSPEPAPSIDDARGHKAVLFCQDCGHASPVDGDWRVRTIGDHQRTRCPECRRVVDDRRPAERSGDDRVQWCVDAWSRYWSAWTALLARDPHTAES